MKYIVFLPLWGACISMLSAQIWLHGKIQMHGSPNMQVQLYNAGWYQEQDPGLYYPFSTFFTGKIPAEIEGTVPFRQLVIEKPEGGIKLRKASLKVGDTLIWTSGRISGDSLSELVLDHPFTGKTETLISPDAWASVWVRRYAHEESGLLFPVGGIRKNWIYSSPALPVQNNGCLEIRFRDKGDILSGWNFPRFATDTALLLTGWIPHGAWEIKWQTGKFPVLGASYNFQVSSQMPDMLTGTEPLFLMGWHEDETETLIHPACWTAPGLIEAGTETVDKDLFLAWVMGDNTEPLYLYPQPVLDCRLPQPLLLFSAQSPVKDALIVEYSSDLQHWSRSVSQPAESGKIAFPVQGVYARWWYDLQESQIFGNIISLHCPGILADAWFLGGTGPETVLFGPLNIRCQGVVLDLSGKVLKTFEWSGLSENLSLGSLMPGTFVVVIYDPTGPVVLRR